MDRTRDEEKDPFDMGLLKLPRLTTPERQGFENFRERQRKRAGIPGPDADPIAEMAKKGGPTPLGLDPVEGDPVDMREWFEQGEAATPEQVAEAEAEARAMLSKESDIDGFGDGLDKFV